MGKLGNKGVTLTELMAALAILGIILVPISFVFYTGYNNYFIENDEMTAQQKAKEALEMIILDLRMYENEYTAVDSVAKSLMIKDSTNFPGEEIVYIYQPDEKKIYKNGAALFDEVEAMEVTGFEVEEIKPSDYDSSLINISIAVKTGRSETINLSGTFRRKAK